MDHTACQKKVRGLSDDALIYTRKDLLETIKLQEEMNRKGYRVPKLGDYWDELHYVCAEIQRRKKLASRAFFS